MKVLAWHPDVFFSDFAEIRPTMKEVMEESDYLSLHMPLIEPTRGIINKKTLAYCKDGTYMVNTGRGPCVVEEDIVEALKSGKLAGFATDVWASDPPKDSPLFDAPHTLFTPHIGASTKENMIRIGIIADQLVDEYVKSKNK